MSCIVWCGFLFRWARRVAGHDAALALGTSEELDARLSVVGRADFRGSRVWVRPVSVRVREMLRLEGMSFSTDQGPVAQGFVRFGDLTVLTGRNDAGKTRLLGLIRTSLNRPEKCEFIDLFGVMAGEEVSELIDPDDEDRSELERDVECLDGFPVTLEVPDRPDGVRVAVRLDWGTFRAWRYGRSPAALEQGLAERLIDELPAGFHSGDPLEPVKLAYLGKTHREALPDAIVVPPPPDVLVREVSFVVLRLARALQELALMWKARLAGDGPPEGLDESFIGSVLKGGVVGGVPSWRWLVEEREHATVVHPAAIAACAALERIAQGLVPEFIREDYRLELATAQPSEIVAGHPVRLGLMHLYPVPESEDPADWDEDDLAMRFGLDGAPGGFAVWLQLALFEAIARATRISHVLEDCARRISNLGHDADTGLLPYRPIDAPLDEGLVADRAELEDRAEERLAAIRSMCDQALGYLREPTPFPPARIDLSLRSDAYLEDLDGEDIAGFFAAPRHRLYLIDEPEQRLHPALARRAARWLRSAMGQWDAQCIIATHSIAFIDLPNACVYELAREGVRSTIRPLDPAHLTPYTELARAIGFDRGELLPRWRAFLLTDPNTAVLLEEFYADRLERAWIKLIPTNFDPGPSSLAEITILWQLTTAPVILVSVSVSPEEIAQLRDGDATDRAQAAQRSPELAVLVRVVHLAIEHEHPIEVLTLNQPDVLDLLDPQAIRDATRSPEHPPYPNHRTAHEQYNHAIREQPQLTYPALLHTAYGINHNPETIRAIARHTKIKEQPPPPPLLDLIWQIEQITLSSETTPPKPT